MAKRFTDTGKWKRPWFRALTVHAKVLWQYLLDECDHCGVFVADFDLISFQVGFKVDEAKLRDLIGEKLVKIDKDRYFIPSFYEFQYADAKDGFRAKQSALKSLRSLGLVDEETESLKDFTNSYLSVQRESLDYPSIGISKSKIKSNTGECEGERKFHPFAETWNTAVRSLPQVRGWGPVRQKAAEKFLASHPPEAWTEICRKVEASDFLSGRNGEWTGCGVDWCLKPGNALKVIEGNYDNRSGTRVMDLDLSGVRFEEGA